MSEIRLYQGNCLEVMTQIESNSVDFILTDLPYGTTACKWDTIIPFEPMWAQFNRVIKPHGAIALFCNQPFTSRLICSNLHGFKYCWAWNKKIPSGMGYAKYRPMQQTEDIAIFTKNGEKSVYYPQLIPREKPIVSGGNRVQARQYGGFKCIAEGTSYKKTYEYKQPTTLIEFSKIRKGGVHETQKPVPLLEYFIKTYTQEGEMVLDACMGSGSTGVACKRLNRDFIGIELDNHYFEIARQRIRLGE